VTARKALRKLFERVQENLLSREPSPFVDPLIVFRDDEWPRLEIGMKSWTAIFGEKAYVNKLYVYYQTKAAWGGEAEGFYFEVILWHKHHRSDWTLAKSKLPQWLSILRKNDFGHWTLLKGNRELEKAADKYDFPEAPTQISACSNDPNIAYIAEADLQTKRDIDLVNLCIARIDQHCAVISAFK